MDCSMPGFPVHHQLLEFTQTHVHWISDAIQPFPPLSSPSPPASNLSSIGVFYDESVLRIRWPKYWSCSLSISPSNEYSGLISFRMDWFDNLAVQGTLKSLLQHHSSKASILRCSAFFMVQLSHPYMTTGKTIALSQLFTWGGQSIGVSASTSVLPMNTQDWSPLEWTCCISLQSKGLSRVFSNTTVQKHQFFSTQLFL